MTEKQITEWDRIQSILRAEIGDDAFNAWIKNLNFKNIEDGTVLFSARTPFVRDWVRRHYADRIKELWEREGAKVFSVDITVDKKTAADSSFSGAAGAGKAFAQGVLTDSFGSVLDPRYTFDSFVVGKSNELAYAAARRAAESEQVLFNPLFLHGGVGLGKTHLMHAIASEVTRLHPGRKVMYLSAEKFMYQFITAIRSKTTVEFKRQFRTVELLMIDDVQFIANKESTQEEFFHTFNALIDNRRQVIISADRSPTDLADDFIDSDGAVGFALDSGTLRLAIVRPAGLEVNDKTSYLGLEVSLAGASLVGVEGLTLKVSGTVLVNRATSAAGVAETDADLRIDSPRGEDTRHLLARVVKSSERESLGLAGIKGGDRRHDLDTRQPGRRDGRGGRDRRRAGSNGWRG
ncbi:MAG: ATP-binding protein, partial [Proteobacteria bacterium]|nr:ATP-binding protein [Pseudomonadota bacterium]